MCWCCTHNNNPDIPQPKTLNERRYPHHVESPYCRIHCQNPDDSDACDTYKASRYDLHKSNRDAIRQYRLKLELMYDNSDLHCMLQGLQTIIDYRGKSSCDYKGKSSCVSSCQTIPSHPGRISLLWATRCFRSQRLTWGKLSKEWILTKPLA